MLERGAKKMDAPIKDYDLWMAWVKDADGNAVEIMRPLPDEIVETALQSGQLFDGTKE